MANDRLSWGRVPPAAPHTPCAACAVCGLRDARALLEVELSGLSSVVLCGSHELVLRRLAKMPRTVGELRVMVGERRQMHRRAAGEIDELAARLSDAFAPNRRTRERRAS
jgi:hypothetical protein